MRGAIDYDESMCDKCYHGYCSHGLSNYYFLHCVYGNNKFNKEDVIFNYG